MAKQLFKGFKQVLSGESFENGYVYFVREDDTLEHGYLYFNGKKYGTTKEVYDELVALQAISADTRLEALEALSAGTRLTALEDAVATADTRLDALEEAIATADTRLDALEAASGDADERLDALEEAIATADTRLDEIEADYLTSADKEAILDAVETALTAEQEARVADDVKDIRYDASAKTIYIEYNDGSVSTGFSAADFVVDGMLSSVTYDATAHTITFIWNTDAGGKEITIDLDDVIAPYHADEQTVHLGENNTFSAIMDQAGGVASHSALTAEAAARADEDDRLEGLIEDEVEAREDAVTALTAAIEAEATARADEDARLEGHIKDEAEAREDAVTALTAAIEAEASARTAADEALSGRIDDIETIIEGWDAEVSGESNDVIVTVTQENGALTGVVVNAPNAITSLEVNGAAAAVSGHAASVEIDTDDIKVASDIPSGVTSGTTITSTLEDIYEKLAAAAQKFDVESHDNSIIVSGDTDTIDLVLNRETATDATVAAGHIEILQNASGETYAQMYYDGNDVD